jgi:hypothetical protein
VRWRSRAGCSSVSVQLSGAGLDIGTGGDGDGVLEIVEEGIKIMLRRSRTDQEGAGQQVAIPRDADFGALDALQAWLSAAGIKDGPVFRPLIKGGTVRDMRLTTHAVAVIIKEAVVAGCLARTSAPAVSLVIRFARASLRQLRLTASRARTSHAKRRISQLRWCSATS